MAYSYGGEIGGMDPFSGVMPVTSKGYLAGARAADDEAKFQRETAGRNAVAQLAADEAAADVWHDERGKQKSGLGGVIGRIGGSIIGSAIPGVGTALGSTIGGGLGSFFG